MEVESVVEVVAIVSMVDAPVTDKVEELTVINVLVPATVKPIPINTFFATPTPPDVVSDPEIEEVESVLAFIISVVTLVVPRSVADVKDGGPVTDMLENVADVPVIDPDILTDPPMNTDLLIPTPPLITVDPVVTDVESKVPETTNVFALHVVDVNVLDVSDVIIVGTLTTIDVEFAENTLPMVNVLVLTLEDVIVCPMNTFLWTPIPPASIRLPLEIPLESVILVIWVIPDDTIPPVLIVFATFNPPLSTSDPVVDVDSVVSRMATGVKKL